MECSLSFDFIVTNDIIHGIDIIKVFSCKTRQIMFVKQSLPLLPHSSLSFCI